MIGGGLLGLEAAAGLNARDMDVTVLHLMPTLMERQLDPAAGYMLQRELEARGIKIITKAQTKAILGERKVEGVELADGRIMPANLVVMAAGIRPNAWLAKHAGLDGQSRRPRRCRHAHFRSRHHRARRMRGGRRSRLRPRRAALRDGAGRRGAPDGRDLAAFVHTDTPTKLKVTGIDLFSLGDFADGEDRAGDRAARRCAPASTSASCSRTTASSAPCSTAKRPTAPGSIDLKKRQVDITEMRETLIFGQAYQGGAPLDPMAAVAALPDDAEICGCNGVCKGKITGFDQREGTEHARRRARAYQGVRLLRLVHGARRAAHDADARRRLQPVRRATDLHLHLARARRCAPPDQGEGPEDHPRGDAGAGVEDLVRLREVPPGAQLLPRLRLARRICRRLSIALHQRARARQHPEGRHLLCRAAHVGRRDECRTSCAPSPMWSTSSPSRR